MKINFNIQSVVFFCGCLLVLACSSLDASEHEPSNKLMEAKQSEQAYLKAAELIGQLISTKSYAEALSSARNMESGFLKASMFMEIATALRNDEKIEQANSLLDAAFDELHFEGNAALRASTFALLSDEFRQSGKKLKASKALSEARLSLNKIERFETGVELSAVFAVAKSYASAGDIKTAKTVAKLVNAQPGDSLMSAIDKITSKSAVENK